MGSTSQVVLSNKRRESLFPACYLRGEGPFVFTFEFLACFCALAGWKHVPMNAGSLLKVLCEMGISHPRHTVFRGVVLHSGVPG